MLKLKRTNILHRLLNKNPLYITILYIMLIWIFLILTIFLDADFIITRFPHVFKFFSIVITLIPILMTFYHVIYFRKSLDSFVRLFSLYIQVVLLFGTMYFTMQSGIVKKSFLGANVHYILVSETPIRDINNKWVKQIINHDTDKYDILYNAFLSYLDCIHFSLVTSSTVGYGDMVPKSPYAKLTVDFQIIISFLIVAFGIGIFITSKDRKEKLKLIRILDLNDDDVREANHKELNTYKVQIENRVINVSST